MKPKVQKKKQENVVWGVTKDTLVSLVSNNRCIDAASKRPWWIALIIALVAIWLPVFPIMSSYSRTSGAAFVGTYGYGFQDELPALTSALHYANDDTKTYNVLNKKVDFKVNENKKLDIYVDNSSTPNNDDFTVLDVEHPESFTPIASYVSNYTKSGVLTHQKEFEIYFVSGAFKSEVAPIIDYLAQRKYEIDSTDTPWTDSSVVTAYTPSFLVLHENGLYCRLYKQNDTKASGSTLAADWKHTKKDVFLIADRLLTVKGFDEEQINNSLYVEGVYKNWKGVFSETYKTQKAFNVRFFMGLYLGVYAVLVLMMGLLVFFMTRGKHNMFNYLKFIECLKISWWAALSPALLAMIFSFLMPGLASMLFIVLMGLRIMWLSMKQLRPQ